MLGNHEWFLNVSLGLSASAELLVLTLSRSESGVLFIRGDIVWTSSVSRIMGRFSFCFHRFFHCATQICITRTCCRKIAVCPSVCLSVTRQYCV